jgi:Nitroreductase family
MVKGGDVSMENQRLSAVDVLEGGPLLETRPEKTLSELVRERRATPAFSSAPVSEDALCKILQAGLGAPSSYNMQPWRFIVVRDIEQRKRLRRAAMNQEQVEQAPVVIVACGDTEGWKEDLAEVIRIGSFHGVNGESHIERKRKNVMADLGSQPNMGMWVTKQTMIASHNHDVDGRGPGLQHRPDGRVL